MAQIPFNVSIETGGAPQTLGELKKRISDINKELAATKVGSSEYRSLVSQLSKARDEFGDFRKEVAAFNPEERAQAFSQLGRSLAGGLEAAASAAAFFGVNEENVLQQVVKLQAATQFFNGIQEAGEAIKQANILKSIALHKLETLETKAGIVATEGATVAQRLLNLAMASNPVGLVVAGITALVAIVITYSKVTAHAREEEEKRITTTDGLRIANDELRESHEKSIKVLRDLDDAYKLSALKAGEAEKQRVEEIRRAQDAAAELRKKYEERRKEIEDEAFILETTRNEKRAQNEKDFQVAIEDLTREHEARLRNIQQAADIKADDEAAKKAEADKKKQDERNKQLAQQIRENNAKLQQEIEDARVADIQNEELRARTKAQLDHDRRIAEIDALKADEALKAQARAEADIALNDQLAAISNDFEAKRNDAAAAQYEREKELAEQRKQLKIDEIDADKAYADARISLAGTVVNGLTALANIFAKNGAKQSAFAKSLVVAQIAIDTAQAISAAVAGAAKAAAAGGPAAPFLQVTYMASGIASVLSGIAKAKQALSKAGGVTAPSFEGAGGGGGIGQPTLAPTNLNRATGESTLINERAVEAGQTTVTSRAYVLESDITDSQKRLRTIERRSKI